MSIVNTIRDQWGAKEQNHVMKNKSELNKSCPPHMESHKAKLSGNLSVDRAIHNTAKNGEI